MCLTSVVCCTVFIVSHQTAGMLWGRGLAVLVWQAPCVRSLVTRVHVAVKAVALRRNLAQRHHLQTVLLAGRHAMHYRQSAAGEGAIGLVVTSAQRQREMERKVRHVFIKRCCCIDAHPLSTLPSLHTPLWFFLSAKLCLNTLNQWSPIVRDPFEDIGAM